MNAKKYVNEVCHDKTLVKLIANNFVFKRKKNRITDALKMLERCISLEPRFVQAYVELLLLSDDGDKQNILDRLVKLEPTNWEHYVLYGNWYKGRGLSPLSMKYYTMAMRLALGGNTQSHERGKIQTLRAAALLVRSMGQRARVLQMITRWHAARVGGQPIGSRQLAERAWRLRSELAVRAALYQRPARLRNQVSTCLHHSQLEVSEVQYVSVKQDEFTKPDKVSAPNVAPALDNNQKYDNEKSCQKNEDILKTSVSLPNQFRLTHNKSESGHKQKNPPVSEKKEIKDTEAFKPFVSDHLIKTY